MIFHPSPLCGTLTLPESKSLQHRELIAGFLSGEFSLPENACDDVQATFEGLCTLRQGGKEVNCRESGSTLRFLLPLAAALGRTEVTFSGRGSLLHRPLPYPLPLQRTPQGYRLREALKSGRFVVDSAQTSQIISGLLMALPLLPGDSSIMLTKKPVSQGYITMTQKVLHRHGITILPVQSGFHIPGNQKYQASPPLIEGDWSAACWYALFCPRVTLKNVSPASCQPDVKVLDYVNRLPSEIDIAPTPDLLPALALAAALHDGQTTLFTGGAFLRGKESDRLHTTAETLLALGGQVRESSDGLCITGVRRLHGGQVTTWGDHRIALLAAFASLFCENPVIVDDMRCIEKSYPQFLRDFIRLGGKVEDRSL